MAISANQLSNALVDALDQYGNSVGKNLDEVSEELAKEGAKILKQTSPMLTGDYRKGWKVKREKKRRKRIRNFDAHVIHNKTDYRLTHLLEKGHATADGTGRVDAKVHIQPVEEKIVNEIETRMAQAVNRR